MKNLELKIPPPAAGLLIGLAMWWTAHLLAAVHPVETFRTIVTGAFAALGLTVALFGV